MSLTKDIRKGDVMNYINLMIYNWFKCKENDYKKKGVRFLSK